MPHISIKAETLFTVFGFPVTNSYVASLVGIGLFLLVGVYYSAQVRKTEKSSLFYVIHICVKALYDLFGQIVGANNDYFFPLLGGFFIYILIQNWFGLIPGVGSVMVQVQEHGILASIPLLRGSDADLNGTLALAIISVFFIQYFGIQFLGFFGYVSKFINIKGPIEFFIGFLDIISEISKIISFAFRLFGNIFAGEVLMTIVAFLVPVLASFPFLLLELFVGVIQALVFAMLTAVFIQIAIQKHHETA